MAVLKCRTRRFDKAGNDVSAETSSIAKPTRFRSRKIKGGTQRLGFRKNKVVEVRTCKKE